MAQKHTNEKAEKHPAPPLSVTETSFAPMVPSSAPEPKNGGPEITPFAQSVNTVTPDGPTPPTNYTGQIGMRPPTTAGLNPIDDGSPGSLVAFAAPSAGGTAFEGAGTEVVVTASVPNPSPAGQMQTVSCLGNYTATPNGSHASTGSPVVNPTITGLAPASPASGGGTIALTVTGLNFTKQSVVVVNGVPQTTTFTNAQTLAVAAAPKKATAGSIPVTVVTGGVVTAPTNWTFT